MPCRKCLSPMSGGECWCRDRLRVRVGSSGEQDAGRDDPDRGEGEERDAGGREVDDGERHGDPAGNAERPRARDQGSGAEEHDSHPAVKAREVLMSRALSVCIALGLM
jgi:hypothetical protein